MCWGLPGDSSFVLLRCAERGVWRRKSFDQMVMVRVGSSTPYVFDGGEGGTKG